MRVLLSLLALFAASIAQAQETPDAYLGDRMPYAVFDRLPATRIVVSGGEIMVGIAPGHWTSRARGCSAGSSDARTWW